MTEVVDEPAAAEIQPSSTSNLRPHLLLFLVPPLLVVLGTFSLMRSKASDIGQYGLIQAFHPS